MNEYYQTVSATGPSAWLRMDTQGYSNHVYHILVEVENTPSNLVDVEFAIESDLTDPTPVCHDVLRDVRQTTASIIHAPCTAIRLNVRSLRSGGDVTIRILQS